MLIGELVKRTGFSRDTIRFYEKHGLISIGRKERRDNNYKEYSEEILHRLLHIKLLKSFGFTLNESSEVLDMIEANEATCQNMAGKIDEKIKEMQTIRDMLNAKVKECLGSCELQPADKNCPIVDPERL